jgi:hypothetical protein
VQAANRAMIDAVCSIRRVTPYPCGALVAMCGGIINFSLVANYQNNTPLIAIMINR